MAKTITKTAHSPTLDTILMVEDTIQNTGGSIMTIAELKRNLPRKVNHNTLKLILRYLEKSHKILVSIEGIIWTYTPPEVLERMMKEGIKH